MRPIEDFLIYLQNQSSCRSFCMLELPQHLVTILSPPLLRHLSMEMAMHAYANKQRFETEHIHNTP